MSEDAPRRNRAVDPPPATEASLWTDATSFHDVVDAGGASVQVLFFSNPGCEKCPPVRRRLENALGSLSQTGGVKLFSVNTFDEEAEGLVDSFCVAKVPSLVALRHGNVALNALVRTDASVDEAVAEIRCMHEQGCAPSLELDADF